MTGLEVTSLWLTDDVGFLAPCVRDLQRAFKCFAAECAVAKERDITTGGCKNFRIFTSGQCYYRWTTLCYWGMGSVCGQTMFLTPSMVTGCEWSQVQVVEIRFVCRNAYSLKMGGTLTTLHNSIKPPEGPWNKATLAINWKKASSGDLSIF